MYETHDAYIAVVELAGVDPDGVTIEIEGEAIAISGSRSPAAPPQGAACLQLEIPFGTFERRLVLPSPVDAGAASADFGDGILSVRLPKLRQQPTRVQIDIQRPE